MNVLVSLKSIANLLSLVIIFFQS